MVDVSVVSHLHRVAIEIVHLAVYEVVSFSFDLHCTRAPVVHNAAHFMFNTPVSNDMAI